jgi:N-acetylmuramoyl-L-alanine amidase
VSAASCLRRGGAVLPADAAPGAEAGSTICGEERRESCINLSSDGAVRGAVGNSQRAREGAAWPMRAALAPGVPVGNHIAPPRLCVLTGDMGPRERAASIASVAAIALLLALLAARALALPVPYLWGGKQARIELPPALAYDLPPVVGAADASQPLVMIDPGHGGFDSGARTPAMDEKDLTLALALALRDRLLADGGVRVALTRDDDSFVALGERAEAARRRGADLFLSIHADSAGMENERAGEIAGASIYTLSERASDAAARRFAARENAADRINGQALSGQSATVNAILVDLSQRRTQAQSERLAALIEREGRGRLVFHPDPRRSAALEVLRAPDVPSVLFESGYITNPQDVARLVSGPGRTEFAGVMARAIRLWFAQARIEAGRRGEEANQGRPIRDSP